MSLDQKKVDTFVHAFQSPYLDRNATMNCIAESLPEGLAALDQIERSIGTLRKELIERNAKLRAAAARKKAKKK